jgi:AcrR family transcriptional regulator
LSQAAPILSRRDRKKARTRGDIYETAMELFSQNGFAAVTISQICEAADVGRGTFFLHFPSKAALLYEFNERVAEEFAEQLDPSHSSAHEQLRALVEKMGTELAARSEIMAAMLAEFFTSPETIALASQHGAALADLVTRIIERGQADGEFDSTLDARLAAASFLSTAAAFISVKVIGGISTLSDVEIQRQFLQLTFHGLGIATR